MLYLGWQQKRVWSSWSCETPRQVLEVTGDLRLQSCSHGFVPSFTGKLTFTCQINHVARLNITIEISNSAQLSRCKLFPDSPLFILLNPQEPQNCVVMHENQVKQWLVNMVGDDDWKLQEAAAGCISNIRHLALANDINRSR